MYFHYCSVDTFKDIMKSQVIWLSDLTSSNDTQEVTRTFCDLWEAVKWRLMKSDLDKDIIDKKLKFLITSISLKLSFINPTEYVFVRVLMYSSNG